MNLLSTVHRPQFQDAHHHERGTGRLLQRPEAVNDYNINMRLVDKSDAVISSVECARKTMRWYKKMFLQLLDTTLYNCQILQRQLTGHRETREDFCIESARELQLKYKPHEIHQFRPGQRQQVNSLNPRLMEWHILSTIPAIPSNPRPQKRCHICRATTLGTLRCQDTRYWCELCNLGFCLEPCFKDYHTLNDC